MYRHYFNIERKQLQWQSEQHQVQQEAVHIQHRKRRKSPHRLNVRVRPKEQAHQHRAGRPLPHQGVTHSLILRQRQSRQHQRLQQQRQARLQKVPNQKLRQQKRMHPSEQAVQIKQKGTANIIGKQQKTRFIRIFFQRC